MEALEQIVDQLKALACHPSQEEVLKMGDRFLINEYELAAAYYKLLCKKTGIEFLLPLHLSITDAGTPQLFERGGFPWGAFPYPRQLAELAAIYLELGEITSCEAIVKWLQRFAVTHKGFPLHSLFTQEKACDCLQLDQMFAHILEKPLFGTFADQECGLVVSRSLEKTLFSAASGCKSGMGGYLTGDAGIINFGPQKLPLGSLETFGLAGRPHYLQLSYDENQFEMHFETRLAAPNPRKTGIRDLEDSGYSGAWIKGEMKYQDSRLLIKGAIEECKETDKWIFVFFGKGSACVVAGTHKLSPRSLDRYKGPSQQVAFIGKEGKVLLEALEPCQMEIIPLAGEGCFWSADFLVAFSSLSRNSFNYFVE